MYDSTITTLTTTVFDPADTSVPLYELELSFFADLGAHIPPPDHALTAVDGEGTDITETLGTLRLPTGAFQESGSRGTDITMTWHALGPDTMTLSVFDTGNRTAVPTVEEEAEGSPGWRFEAFAGQPGGRYLIGTPSVFRTYVTGSKITVVSPERFPQEGDVWTLRQRHYYVSEEGDTIPASRPPVPGTRYRIQLVSGGQEEGEIDLSQVRVVPNPYLGYSEFEFGPAGQRMIQFINLPPECTIRIYTIAGILVRVLEHHPGEGGTENYDLKTREGLRIASGNYYYHITVPDGRTRMGRFAVIQ
jgi:hypothetical protein